MVFFHPSIHPSFAYFVDLIVSVDVLADVSFQVGVELSRRREESQANAQEFPTLDWTLSDGEEEEQVLLPSTIIIIIIIVNL